jgi:hypothetical protein
MHLVVSLLYLISLMHGHGLFKKLSNMFINSMFPTALGHPIKVWDS